MLSEKLKGPFEEPRSEWGEGGGGNCKREFTGLDWINPVEVSLIVDCCEHSNDPLGSMNGGEIVC
jgi:hypothetical protein